MINSSLMRALIILPVLTYMSACSYLPFMGEDEEKVEITLREPAELSAIDAQIILAEVWNSSLSTEDNTSTRLFTHALQDKLVFASVNGNVRAVSSQDGRTIWTVDMQDTLSGGVGGNNNIAVVGSRNGVVTALQPSDGSILWSLALGLEISAVAHTQDDTIVVRTNNNQIVTLAADTAAKRWTASQQSPALTLRGGSVPITLDGVVYAGMDNGKLVAISLATGTTLWESRVSVPSGRSELERLVDVDGQIVVTDTLVYAASYHGRVVAIDRTNGRTVWARDISSIQGLTLDQDLVYVTDRDDHIWALERESGITIWRQDKFEYRAVSAPMQLADYILIGDFEGYVHALSKQDGTIIGRKKVTSGTVHSAGTATSSQVHVIQQGGQLAAIAVQ